MQCSQTLSDQLWCMLGREDALRILPHTATYRLWSTRELCAATHAPRRWTVHHAVSSAGMKKCSTRQRTQCHGPARSPRYALARCSHTLLLLPLAGPYWRCTACELGFGEFASSPQQPPASGAPLIEAVCALTVSSR